MKEDIFHAIADPTRRSILELIADRAMTPNELAENFDITRQAVSKHIRILSDCRLLEQEKTGREIYYHINPFKMKEVDVWLQRFRKHWENSFDQLDKVLINLNSENDEK